jgi:hypothetical protein
MRGDYSAAPRRARPGAACPPEWVGEEFVRALRRGRPRFLAGASNRALLLIQRIAPRLAARIMTDIGLRAGAKAARATS